MAKKYNIAVVGATGSVGSQVLNILAERNFPVGNLYAIASSESLGKKVSFGEDKILEIHNLENFDFGNVDIVFSCAGSEVSRKFVSIATSKGAVVIDKTSLYRLDKDVPLIVPEANLNEIKNFTKKNIISNPNCCTIPIVTVLKPLDNAVKIKRIVASTYQSVSGAGKKGMDELYNQTKGKYMNAVSNTSVFSKQIAFNVIPFIGDIYENGESDEEYKIIREISKIMGELVKTSVTCVRVPVFIGHSISLNIEFSGNITAKEVVELLSEADGVHVLQENNKDKIMTPAEIVGEDYVYVSRVRDDISLDNTINLWLSSDNIRKGAALNAVQIAEELIKYI